MSVRMRVGRLSVVAIAVLVALGLLFGCAGIPESSGDTDSSSQSQEDKPQTVDTSFPEANKSASGARNISPAPDPSESPWPFEPFDVEHVRKLGHLGHYEGGCAYGAFNALIQPLQEKVGYPYNQIPTFMLDFGKGGVLGSGGTCGTILGSMAAINLIAGADYFPIAMDLMEYYETTPFPTDISNEYAVNREFLVDEYRTDEALPQSVAGSVSCDESDSNWLEEAGYEPGGPESKERCARLTGDIAAKAAELLNTWAASRPATADAGGASGGRFGGIFTSAEYTEVAEDVYRANQACQVLGYVAVGRGSGYEDGLVVAVGMEPDGRIAGVRVLEHNETEGIGSKVTEDAYLSQYEGLTPGELAPAEEGGPVDAVSGATVSSKAVAEIVRAQAQRLEQHAE
ncbi:MAG: FMN-binding protein [Bacteroidetes bacterium]|nr:FMN-binding protein [Bacteroidota bacterium]